MTGLVTLGEQMGQLNAEREGPLRVGSPMSVSVCGAEATVAVGVRRLGHEATYLGRVGDDAFGRAGLELLRAEGVGCDRMVVDPSAPTGLLLRIRRTSELTVVEYLRAGSAGSRLCPEDLDEDAIAAADLLHVTGITVALSPTAQRAVHRAVAVARAANVPVSFDVNYRATLWSRDEAAARLRPLAAVADIVIGGPYELPILVPDLAPDLPAEELLGAVAELGPREIVLTQGVGGATSQLDGTVRHVDAHPVRAVDVVGAGDAFVAGYLAARMDGADPEARLKLGAVTGAFAVTSRGDWEGLPHRSELALFDHVDDVLR